VVPGEGHRAPQPVHRDREIAGRRESRRQVEGLEVRCDRACHIATLCLHKNLVPKAS